MGKKNAKKDKETKSILGLVLALVVVVAGSLLFVAAVGGWFDNPKMIVDEEFRGDEMEFIELSRGEYEDLINNKKSFVVFIDQKGCTTADRVRGFAEDFMAENKVRVHRMMFEEMKESSLHEYVKYYPSVVLVDKGVVRSYLKADTDEDADKYNDYEVFKGWIGENIQF